MGIEKKYYWLKLKDNFFDDETIKYIEEQENGIVYSNFYLKLCLKSIKSGGKLIRLVGSCLMPYDVKSIASLTNVPVDTVAVAMRLFEQIGLVERLDSGEIFLTQINEMIGSETSKAELMRRKRAQDRVSSGNNVTAALPECYTEIKRLEIRDKEIRDKEKERGKENRWQDEAPPDAERPAPPLSHVPYEQIKDLYNRLCPSLPKCMAMSEARKKAVKARFSSGYTMEDFQRLFEKTEASSFLKGANSRNWRASFDWITKDSNMAKVLDGNYDDHGAEQWQQPQAPPQSSNPFLEMLREEEARNGQNRDH